MIRRLEHRPTEMLVHHLHRVIDILLLDFLLLRSHLLGSRERSSPSPAPAGPSRCASGPDCDRYASAANSSLTFACLRRLIRPRPHRRHHHHYRQHHYPTLHLQFLALNLFQNLLGIQWLPRKVIQAERQRCEADHTDPIFMQRVGGARNLESPCRLQPHTASRKRPAVP